MSDILNHMREEKRMNVADEWQLCLTHSTACRNRERERKWTKANTENDRNYRKESTEENVNETLDSVCENVLHDALHFSQPAGKRIVMTL